MPSAQKLKLVATTKKEHFYQYCVYRNRTVYRCFVHAFSLEKVCLMVCQWELRIQGRQCSTPVRGLAKPWPGYIALPTPQNNIFSRTAIADT